MPTVMKFGGTSVADAPAFENVARIVASQRSVAPVVVVSAMSGVTDALLAATIAAGEGRGDEAIASLEESFRRHHKTAADLLTPTAAQTFAKQVDNAAHQINELLRSSADNPLRRRPTQDAVLAYGEMLSSELLALLLNERGVNAQHVDARRCIVTDDEYTCALPLMSYQRTSVPLAL